MSPKEISNSILKEAVNEASQSKNVDSNFDFKKNPFENFLSLYRQAELKGVPDANAMALATVDSNHRPSVRIVLYKGMKNLIINSDLKPNESSSENGLCFYTNYNGRKAIDIDLNPYVAATFFWSHLDQQIRFEGQVKKLSFEESEKYFHSRPRLSQLGAWTSQQSKKLESFSEFQTLFSEVEKKYQGQTIPCPPYWGGYCLIPDEVEFWFGKTGRLHERYVYQKINSADQSTLTWDKFLRFP